MVSGFNRGHILCKLMKLRGAGKNLTQTTNKHETETCLSGHSHHKYDDNEHFKLSMSRTTNISK